MLFNLISIFRLLFKNDSIEIDRKPQTNRSNSVNIYKYMYIGVCSNLIVADKAKINRFESFMLLYLKNISFFGHSSTFDIVIWNILKYSFDIGYLDTLNNQTTDQWTWHRHRHIYTHRYFCYFQFVCIIFYIFRLARKFTAFNLNISRMNPTDPNDKLFQPKLSF